MNSVIHRLKLMRQTPENGLAIFCGLVSLNHSAALSSASASSGTALAGMDQHVGFEASSGSSLSSNALLGGGGSSKNEAMKKVCVVLEPPIVPLKRNLYYCDSRFHVEDLMEQMEELDSSETFGFVVMSGSHVLIAMLRGTRHRILYEKSIQLPKKHGKGGQSKERFARLRDEAIDLWVKTVAEKANDHFLSSNRDKVLVSGIIFAGSANLKQKLYAESSKLMDYRLSSRIVQVVDVQYGSSQGLKEAIEKTRANFQHLRYVQEQKVVDSFMNTVANAPNRTTIGSSATMYALLEVGAVERLLLFERLDIIRCVFSTNSSDNGNRTVTVAAKSDVVVKYLTREQLMHELKRLERQQQQQQKLSHSHHAAAPRLIEHQLLIDWLLEEDRCEKQYGCSVEIVSDATVEGNQFAVGFGGIGSWLRYEVDVESLMDSNNCSENRLQECHDDDHEGNRDNDDDNIEYDSDLDGFM